VKENVDFGMLAASSPAIESRVDVDRNRAEGFGAPPSRGCGSVYERSRFKVGTRMMIVMVTVMVTKMLCRLADVDV
jgi:hypothetical protein